MRNYGKGIYERRSFKIYRIFEMVKATRSRTAYLEQAFQLIYSEEDALSCINYAELILKTVTKYMKN